MTSALTTFHMCHNVVRPVDRKLKPEAVHRCGLATARGIPEDEGSVDRSKETPEETAARLQRESAQAQAKVRCGIGVCRAVMAHLRTCMLPSALAPLAVPCSSCGHVQWLLCSGCCAVVGSYRREVDTLLV